MAGLEDGAREDSEEEGLMLEGLESGGDSEEDELVKDEQGPEPEWSAKVVRDDEGGARHLWLLNWERVKTSRQETHEAQPMEVRS